LHHGLLLVSKRIPGHLITVEPNQLAHVQMNTRDGEMVLRVEISEEGGPRVELREGSRTTVLFARR
jgi:hypothetical protein